MKICVIGCGRWGSLITWYLAEKKGLDVTLYGRESSAAMRRFISERRNDLLTLPQSVGLSTDISSAKDADVIIISIDSQGLSALMEELSALNLQNIRLVREGTEITQRCSILPEQRENLYTWSEHLHPLMITEKNFCRVLPM